MSEPVSTQRNLPMASLEKAVLGPRLREIGLTQGAIISRDKAA
jgi:hypothetical protein